VQGKSRSYEMIAAAGILLLVAGGCKSRANSDRASGNTPSATASDSMAMAADTTSSRSTESALSDANIVALLDEANMADSAAGAFALTKATSPDVKAFAKMMMGEHHTLRMQGQQLAQRLNVTPEPPANDPLKPAAESEMAALKAAPKGAQFDRTYIEQEIGAHKLVLDVAEKGHDAAQNEELKKLIEQAKPVIEKHLNRAEEIQKKLGSPST
jgi:putative membrane protein